MAYKWKPNAAQKAAFKEKMQNPIEQAAYYERRASKHLYDNWKNKDFVPTKEQYDFCLQHIGLVMVMSGYSLNEKVNHNYIHIVNQLRRGEILFNNEQNN